MEITNTTFNTLPEQVQENKDNINALNERIMANNIYNAKIEIAQDTSAILAEDIKNFDASKTTSGYVLDTTGKLFKIVAVNNDTVYIDYAATLPRGAQGLRGERGLTGEVGPRGIQGLTGEVGPVGPRGIQGLTGETGAAGVGIASIVAGTPTQSGNNTVTPLTITLTNGNTQLIYIYATNGTDGSQGNSFIVTGSVNSVVDLPDVSTVAYGTAYYVGTTYPRDVFVVVEYQGAKIWQNEGKLQGPIGPVGPVGATGANGANGVDGVGIASIVAGTPTQSGNNTVTPLTITLTNNNTVNFNVVAQNGQDGQTGPQGPAGNTGATGPSGNDGIGISSITAGTPTQSGTTTVTPITIDLTNGNSQTFNVVAENGQDGATGPQGPQGEPGITSHLYLHFITISRSGDVSAICNIYSTSNTPLNTFDLINTYFANTFGNSKGVIANGFYNDNNNIYKVESVSASITTGMFGSRYISIGSRDSSGSYHVYTINSSTTITYYDTVVQIF